MAENCTPLQQQKDARGEFFRHVAEQGHYAGRTQPSATRQGIYACTAGGLLLASVNTRTADHMLAMMHKALQVWQSLGPEERKSPGPFALDPFVPDPKYAVRFPDGGLILQVYARDLPRNSAQTDDWRKNAVNFDHAWFTHEEMLSFIPASEAPGSRHALPWPVVRRFARFHIIDNVRGETPMWGEQDIRHAALFTEVVARKGDQLILRLTGAVKNVGSGRWPIRPFQEKYDIERGMDVTLSGTLHWNVARRRFDRFDLLAIGTRWGGTEHNLRWDDLDRAPIAILFELADEASPQKVPPQGVNWGYFAA